MEQLCFGCSVGKEVGSGNKYYAVRMPSNNGNKDEFKRLVIANKTTIFKKLNSNNTKVIILISWYKI